MSENEGGKSEPTSPRNVAADAAVSIILLAGTFVAETIKGLIPQGVPLAVAVILIVSEITMLVYFVVVLVRAVGYALSQIEQVHASLEGTRTWEVSIKSFRTMTTLLREAFPTLADVRRTLRLALRFMLVMGFVGVGVLALSLYESLPGAVVPDVKAPGAQPSMLTGNEQTAKPQSDPPATDAGISSASGPMRAGKATQEAPNDARPPLSREELEQEREKLERRREEVERLLGEKPHKGAQSSGKHGKARTTLRDAEKRAPNTHKRMQERVLPGGPTFDTRRREAESPAAGSAPMLVELAADGWRESGIVSLISDFAEQAEGYWLTLLLGAAAAALGTFFVSLYTQAIQRVGGHE